MRSNPREELSEFYPPPYDFLGAKRRCTACGLVHATPRGMGQAGSAQQINEIATTGASTTLALLVGLSVVGGPVGAAVAAVIAVGSLIAGLVGQGCGSSCIIASNDANKIEPILQQNLQAYLSSPVHYASLQKAALNNFDTTWQLLVTACADPSLAAAGKRCTSDRQQGSCAYKTSAGGWQNGKYTYPGANGSGSSCWNWFIGYRDPIANDPTVVPDPGASAGSNAGSGVFGSSNAGSGVFGSTFNFGSWLLPAALAGGALLFFFGGDL